MNKAPKIVTGVLALVFCLFFVLSVVDTHETAQTTRFDQERILNHVEKLTENGPRSIVHEQANAAALSYIAATLESYGVIREDTTAQAAYQVQSFVSQDVDYQSFSLKNIIVHLPATAFTALLLPKSLAK